jgi:hypothetical protein
MEQFAVHVLHRKKSYIDLVDEYMQDAMALPGSEHRERFITLARRLDFHSDCLSQITSRNPRISALGSRRAGLYNFTEVADKMIFALNGLSSENQFEILMGLARIGIAEPMQRAFEKIKNSIIVNERAVIEILSSFPMGMEKVTLFRSMFHSETSYVAALFLKAVDKNLSHSLTDEITGLMYHENKETRAAAVRGLANLNTEAPVKDLIKALGDQDWEIRALSAKALGSLKDTESSLALYKALYDQQWWVRQNAAVSLTSHPDYEILFILAAESGDKYCLDSIISALENSGNHILLNSIRKLAV